MNWLFLLLIAIVAIRVNCQSSDDDSSFPGEDNFVHSLPNVSLPLGQNYSTIGHYSGFLRTSFHGIDTPIHYWFFKSQSDNWQIEPLILWHGGYLSFINSALTGISPIRMNRDGTLSVNEHAWNKKANLLFVESFPVVGFICDHVYENATEFENNTSAIQLGLDTLEKFYVKFPQLAQNELYVAGQGYGSFHIMVLAKKLLEKKSSANLKGVLIGNGVFNISDAVNSHFQFVYQMKKNLYEPTFWTNLLDSCCPQKACSPKADCTFRECQTATYQELDWKSKSKSKSKPRSECYRFYDKFVRKLIDNYQKNEKVLDNHNIQEKCAPDVETNCTRYIISKKIYNWFNFGSKAAVREALNIVENGFWWPGNHIYQCDLKRQYPTLHGHLMFLLRSNIRILLYTGDEDGIASKFNTQWLLDDLSLSPVHHGEETFLFDDKLVGFRTHFCEGLTHYGIIDAGHTVAEDQTGATLEMVSQFLFGDHSANAVSHCPLQTVPNCTKYCTTEPLPAKVDGFCDYWIESLHRYYKNYQVYWFEMDPNTGEEIFFEE